MTSAEIYHFLSGYQVICHTTVFKKKIIMRSITVVVTRPTLVPYET